MDATLSKILDWVGEREKEILEFAGDIKVILGTASLALHLVPNPTCSIFHSKSVILVSSTFATW